MQNFTISMLFMAFLVAVAPLAQAADKQAQPQAEHLMLLQSA